MTLEKAFVVAAALLLAATAQASAAMPTPVVQHVGAASCPQNGIAFVCYELSVTNRNSYDMSLFQTAPYLPVCGPNPDPLRIRVEIHELANPGVAIEILCPMRRNDLASLKFAVRKGKYQTGIVFVVIIDALTNERTSSNLVRIYDLPRRPTGVRPGVRPPVSPN